MRPVRILALASAMLAVAPAFAQDSFPDVPANHWAYDALLRMKKDGLLVGYPDGLFRGGRPASRYELAVAMHAVYTNLRNATDGLDAQMKALGGDRGYATQAEAAALRDALAALQADLAAMKGYGADIADLRRASDTFEKELTQLGVDVQAMKDDLRDLAGRVKALEARKPAIDVSGTIDFWAGGGHTDGDRYGLSREGRLTGIRDKGPQAALFPATSKAGITDDVSFLHEAAVTAASTNETGVRFRGTFVLGNAFGQRPLNAGVPSTPLGFGNQSDVFNPSSGDVGTVGEFGYGEGTGDVYIQELGAAFSGRGVDFEAGRVRHRASPWIFQRLDNTLYFDNDRWDDGRYTFDGLVANTKLGPVRAEFYGGNNTSVLSKNGVLLNPIRSGSIDGPLGTGTGQRLSAERILGGTLKGSVKGVGLRGDYLVLDTSGPLLLNSVPLDHVDVYGGEADFRVGRFKTVGGLRQSKAYSNQAHIEGLTDTAWDAKVAWASGRYELWAQYRQVGLNYLAPGDWGRIGILRNPTNIRGFLGSAKVGLSSRFSLSLDGELSHGLDDGDASGTLLGRDTDIDRYAVRLDARLGLACDAFAYYENTSFSGLVPPAPNGSSSAARYQWYGVGLAHGIGGNARFTLAYEQSAIRNDYQTTGGFGNNSFRGGFLTSQVTVRF